MSDVDVKPANSSKKRARRARPLLSIRVRLIVIALLAIAPLMIERVRRLAEKNFLEVLRDLAPSAVDQAQIVVGPPQ